MPADSGYTGWNRHVTRRDVAVRSCARRVRGRDELTDGQQAENRRVSKVRSRAGHICGFMELSMHALQLSTIGMRRVVFSICPASLVYNLTRASCLLCHPQCGGMVP